MGVSVYPPDRIIAGENDGEAENVAVDFQGKVETTSEGEATLHMVLLELRQLNFHVAHMNGMTEVKSEDFTQGG